MPEGLILYVDDEPSNRIVFLQAFQARFRVHCVASAEEALAVLSDERVAVLVTDQRMPGMSGNELLERARALDPDIVRVVITAHSDIEPILRAVNGGLVARYLVKPWDRAELEQILSWAVEVADLAHRDRALQLRLLETERLATLGTISAALMHDLRDPLVTAQLNADALLRHVVGVEPLPTADLPVVAEDLRASLELMDRITRQLAGFGKPFAERAEVPDGGTDPIPSLRYAISVCEQTLIVAKGRIVRDLPRTLPTVEIDAASLTQVLINLLSNAGRALDPGGTVIVSATAHADSVTFRVSDDGRGMTGDALRKAGSAFFSTAERGTGLGLLQCYRLLGARGAKLQLTSAPGRGTTAQFTLRRAPS